MDPSEVYGLYEERAGENLWGLAKTVPGDQAIVELGVYQARSLLYLAEGAKAGNGAPVHGVDPWNLPRASKEKFSSDETYAAAQANVAASAAGFLVHLHRDFSVSAAKAWRGPKVGLLHTDADHRYGPVLDDFAAWRPHLASGAILCWDDYDRATFPGVVDAVNQLHRKGFITEPEVPEGCTRLAVARLAK